MSAQMTRTDPGRDLSEISSREETDALVLRHLRNIANPRGSAAASNRDLAAVLPVSPATARRAIARLMAAGDLELVARGTGGRYRSRFRVHAVATSTTAA